MKFAVFPLRGGGARTFIFGNVVRGKSACPEKRFRTLRPESFAHRKLLPGKFWVFAPLLESSLDIQNRIDQKNKKKYDGTRVLVPRQTFHDRIATLLVV